MAHRVLHWAGTDAWRAETAALELGADGVTATGTQLGVGELPDGTPLPYRADYRLDATDGWRTKTFEVDVTGAGWRRVMLLVRRAEGWQCMAREEGDKLPFDWAGGEVDGLETAVDVDLAFSPLTNLMPVRRLDGAPQDHVMAWVALPDLVLHVSRQRYEPVRPGVVRYIGLDDGFTADLALDPDGLVVTYPGLARRVAG